MEPRVDRLQNRADGILVETFVPVASLEGFQVAADGAFAEEPGVLFGVDPAEREQGVGPLF